MDKKQLIEQLEEHHDAFRRLIGGLAEAAYCTKPFGKWSPGQQLDHILRSLRPVNLAFSLPSPLLKLFFGHSNRPSRSYDALVAKYHDKLAAGGRASKPFVPRDAAWSRQAAMLARLDRRVSALALKVEQYDENQLDRLVLPHPLLGKLTLREMLYFTIYHVQHHQKAVLNGLDKA